VFANPLNGGGNHHVHVADGVSVAFERRPKDDNERETVPICTCQPNITPRELRQIGGIRTRAEPMPSARPAHLGFPFTDRPI